MYSHQTDRRVVITVRGTNMDFNLTEQQKELVALARDIAQKEIAPRALDIDKSGIMDEELLHILKQSGMTQLSVPKEYGGAGLELLTVALIAEELAKDAPVWPPCAQRIPWPLSRCSLQGTMNRRNPTLTA